MWSSSDSIDAIVVEPLTSVLPSSTTVPFATASRSRPTNVADLPGNDVLFWLTSIGLVPSQVTSTEIVCPVVVVNVPTTRAVCSDGDHVKSVLFVVTCKIPVQPDWIWTRR